MKKIEAYQLTDGTIIADEKEALRQQGMMTAHKELTRFWENYQAYGNISTNEVVAACEINAIKLIAILKNYE